MLIGFSSSLSRPRPQVLYNHPLVSESYNTDSYDTTCEDGIVSRMHMNPHPVMLTECSTTYPDNERRIPTPSTVTSRVPQPAQAGSASLQEYTGLRAHAGLNCLRHESAGACIQRKTRTMFKIRWAGSLESTKGPEPTSFRLFTLYALNRLTECMSCHRHVTLNGSIVSHYIGAYTCKVAVRERVAPSYERTLPFSTSCRHIGTIGIIGRPIKLASTRTKHISMHHITSHS